MELAKDRVQWRALVLATLNIRVQLPGVIEVDLREVGCEDGRCMEVAQDRVQKAGFVTGAVEPAGFWYKKWLLSPLVWCHVLKTI